MAKKDYIKAILNLCQGHKILGIFKKTNLLFMHFLKMLSKCM